MGYFRYTKSEDDLREQYRKLLIKYNYKSEKNRKVIDAITKEYEQMAKQARYDNGYRTTGQKIKEKIETNLEEKRKAYKQEENRKKTLANKPYTKQDLQNLMLEQKEYLSKKIPVLVKAQGYSYKQIKQNLLNGQKGRHIYLGCELYISSMGQVERQEIHNMKEKMEYCVFALTGRNEEKTELVLKQIEEQLGQYAERVFLQCEPKSIDPITELEIIRGAKRDKQIAKSDKRALWLLKKFLSIPGYVAIGIGFIMIIDLLSEGHGFELSCFIPFIYGLLWIWIMHMVIKGNLIRAEKRARVRGAEQDKAEYTKRTFLRAILRFIGIGW